MNRYYNTKSEEAQNTDLSAKRWLNDFEAAVYVGIGRTTFRKWAEQIGCKRRIGRRVLNDKVVIDEALSNAKM